MGKGIRLDDYWVIDDRTGVREWASDTEVDYYGCRTKRKIAFPAHPQWFVRSFNDPTPVEDPRPDLSNNVYVSAIPKMIGDVERKPLKNHPMAGYYDLED